MRLAKATLRCCPPVHPTAMVKTDLPSFFVTWQNGLDQGE